MQFKQLKVGQTFDWINPESTANSFHKPCVKTSARKYRTCGKGPIEYFTVGTTNAEVFNVGKYD